MDVVNNGDVSDGSCKSSVPSGNDGSLDSPISPLWKTPDKFQVVQQMESYRDQRRKYRREKKRVARELLSTLNDPAVVVLSDWLKVRGTLKSWTKLWCVLKPGMLLLYKNSKVKNGHWVGTVLLNTCELIERPSKKNGFCFKLFHPLEQSIWATKGPDGESMGAVVQPLPSSHLIFRVPSEAAGKCWMDALELAVRCSSILIRSMTSPHFDTDLLTSPDRSDSKWNDSDDHATDQDDISHTDECDQAMVKMTLESDSGSWPEKEEELAVPEQAHYESLYLLNTEGEMGEIGDQTEELEEESKSLLWFLLKQVRPGMDLSKVVLPTFILEPRSFLDKLSDYYYHSDIIHNAIIQDEPFTRMKEVVRWYISGFYKKPKGLKKPYNPILGEAFRCYWQHPNGSKTFYVAEQVSHHPPVSALYVTNRREGFSISATVCAKSKFYGNSTSALLDGKVCLTLLSRGEDYHMNMPYAHVKGILMGTLTVELGGKVTIECNKTGYRTELEFKLKPFLGGNETINSISGKLKFGKETLATIDGYWDSKVTFMDKSTSEEEILWFVTPETKSKRLQRFTIPLESQENFESEKLWSHVSEAIYNDDQVAATAAKTVLEEAQRNVTKERKLRCEEWIPRYFEQDLVSGIYMYKHADLRPWDIQNDLFQYEHQFVISTKTHHVAPMIRSTSIISVLPKHEDRVGDSLSRVRLKKNRDTDADMPATRLDVQGNKKLARMQSCNEEIVHKLLSSQEALLTEMKLIRRDIETLQRRVAFVSSHGSPAKSQLSTLWETALSVRSVGVVLGSVFIYWAVCWLFNLLQRLRS